MKALKPTPRGTDTVEGRSREDGDVHFRRHPARPQGHLLRDRPGRGVRAPEEPGRSRFHGDVCPRPDREGGALAFLLRGRRCPGTRRAGPCTPSRSAPCSRRTRRSWRQRGEASRTGSMKTRFWCRAALFLLVLLARQRPVRCLPALRSETARRCAPSRELGSASPPPGHDFRAGQGCRGRRRADRPSDRDPRGRLLPGGCAGRGRFPRVREQNPRGFPLDGAGTFIIKRSLKDGSFLQAKVFVQNDPGSFLRLFPRETAP